jgi:hypothetical protein
VLDVKGLCAAGEHGPYQWFNEYAGISIGEYTTTEVMDLYKPRVVSVCPSSAAVDTDVGGSPACNLMLKMAHVNCSDFMGSSAYDVPSRRSSDCFSHSCNADLLKAFYDESEICSCTAAQLPTGWHYI